MIINCNNSDNNDNNDKNNMMRANDTYEAFRDRSGKQAARAKRREQGLPSSESEDDGEVRNRACHEIYTGHLERNCITQF